MSFPLGHIILLSALAVSGCSEIVDSHSGGSSPAGPGPIAGPPNGDSLTSSGNIVFNGGNIQLVAAEPGQQQTGVSFQTAGQPHNTSEYSISFSGVKLTISDLPVLAIDLFDTSQQLACGLEIAGGEFRLVSGNGTTAFGTYSANADQHNVFLRLALGQNRCFVRVEQVPQGQSGPPTQPIFTSDGPFVASGFGDLDQIRFVWEQFNSPTSYFLGRLIATKRN